MQPLSTTSTTKTPQSPSEAELWSRLLESLAGTNDLLAQLARQNTAIGKQVQELLALLRGFTSDGASFLAYQSDSLTTAYLAVIGPLIAGQLAQRGGNLDELTKGAVLMARQLLEELAAYRSTQGAADYLEEQLHAIHDPWHGPDSPPAASRS